MTVIMSEPLNRQNDNKDPIPSLPEACPGLLLSWYDRNRRILPWREDPTPYHVWLSEIMLQQTRVETVIPYYERFLSELPDVSALAQCPQDRLLKLWEGLGYYSRIRNMQKAALLIMEEYSGEIPSDPALLVKLPGIGSYTAAAIASIAFQVPAASVDGNLLRVYARLSAYEEDIRSAALKKQAEAAFLKILPKSRPGDMNQAFMDLGALVCLPNGAPLCDRCPVSSVCLARKYGLQAEIPKAKEKTVRPVRECTVLLIRHAKKLLLRKRPKKGLLAGLYELPNPDGKLSENEVRDLFASAGLRLKSIRPLPPSKHVFTHRVWEMTGYEVVLETAPKTFENGFFKGCFFMSTDMVRKEAALPSAFAGYMV